MDSLKFGLCVLIASVFLLSAADARRKSKKRCPKTDRPCPNRPNRKLTAMCGSDGKTYDSWCAFRKAQCAEGGDDLKITKPVACDADYPCPQSCITAFSEGGRRICGSDGVEYANLCRFREAKYCEKKDIRPVRMKRCKKN